MDTYGSLTAVDFRGRQLGTANTKWTHDHQGNIVTVGKPEIVMDRKGEVYEIVAKIGASQKIIPVRPTVRLRKYDAMVPNVTIRVGYDS
jgi:hypothetical protein